MFLRRRRSPPLSDDHWDLSTQDNTISYRPGLFVPLQGQKGLLTRTPQLNAALKVKLLLFFKIMALNIYMICITTSLVSLQAKADLVKISYGSLYGSGLASKKREKRGEKSYRKSPAMLTDRTQARTPARGLNLPSCGRFTLYIKRTFGVFPQSTQTLKIFPSIVLGCTCQCENTQLTFTASKQLLSVSQPDILLYK